MELFSVDAKIFLKKRWTILELDSQFWFTVPCWVGLPWCHWLIALSQWSLWDWNDQTWTYPGEQQVFQWNVWLELFERLIHQLCSWRQGEISQLDGFGQYDDNDLENKINSYNGIYLDIFSIAYVLCTQFWQEFKEN